MKYRYNRALSDPFYFYRDSKGNEIDVIYEIGGLPFPIEIKAGSTLNSDFFSSLRNFLKQISGPNPYTVPHALLIYAGDREETRNNIRITTPVHLSRTLSEIEK